MEKKVQDEINRIIKKSKGKWVDICVIHSGGETKLYVNGKAHLWQF